VGSKSNDKCPYERGRGRCDTPRREEGDVKKAEEGINCRDMVKSQ